MRERIAKLKTILADETLSAETRDAARRALAELGELPPQPGPEPEQPESEPLLNATPEELKAFEAWQTEHPPIAGYPQPFDDIAGYLRVKREFARVLSTTATGA